MSQKPLRLRALLLLFIALLALSHWAARSILFLQATSARNFPQIAARHERHMSVLPSVGPRTLFPRGANHQPKVVRGPLIFEPFVLGAITLAIILSKPKSAPGPSDDLLERERNAQQDVAAATQALEKLGKVEKEEPRKNEEAPKKEEAREQETLEAAKKEEARKREELEKKLLAEKQEALKRLAQTEAERLAAEAELSEYPVPDFLVDTKGKGNVLIGVTGASGVGKSSFINAIRRVGNKDPEAARTGVTETTMKPQVYPFPSGKPHKDGVFRRAANALRNTFVKDPNANALSVGDQVLLQDLISEDAKTHNGKIAEVVSHRGAEWEVKVDGVLIKVKREQMTGLLGSECVLWDLPGVGTPNFLQADYCKNMGIRHFDIIVMMTANRFTEAELMLVEEMKKFKVPFFCVRNQVDVEVELEIERRGKTNTDSEAQIQSKTVETIKEDLSKFDLGRIYCISTRQRLLEEFDFQQLEKDLGAAVKSQRNI